MEPPEFNDQPREELAASQEPARRVTGSSADPKYGALEKYARDLTSLAVEGRLDPVIGRDEEIGRVIQVLTRRTRNNPVIVGEVGVGKTAVAEGLALRIAAGDVPEALKGRRVMALDMCALAAGGEVPDELEERLEAVMDDIGRAQGEIVLFIDELHTVIGAGTSEGSIVASRVLKPALARGEFQCVGATTLDEYRGHVEGERALDRRFQPVYLAEPSVDDTIEILKGLRPRYESHHKIKIEDSALTAAARLSQRYISDRCLPAKAIDLMDEAASKIRVDAASIPAEVKEMQLRVRQLAEEQASSSHQGDHERAAMLKSELLRMEREYGEARDRWLKEKETDEVVSEETIAGLVSRRTGIPVGRMVQEEKDRLVRMETELRRRVVGQRQAIGAVCDAVRRARAGLKNPRLPIGSFIFLGPTGVGRTELARSLAEFLFGSEGAMVRIDMAEYMEARAVFRLTGAPPGHAVHEESGQLTEAVRLRPYAVVLFSEVEKAHPDVLHVLLRIMEDGRLTDGRGRPVDFKNTVVIMTSNLGSQEFEHGSLGLRREPQSRTERKRLNGSVEGALRQALRPEFLDRIDEIVIFQPLTEDRVMEIVDLMMEEVRDRIEGRNISVVLTQEARAWLAEEGFDPLFGARNLRRTIQREVENPLSKKILLNEFEEGDTVEVDSSPEGLVFSPVGE